MKFTRDGKEVVIKRKLQLKPTARIKQEKINALKKNDVKPKSEKLSELKLFKKCCKKYIKQNKIKPHSLKMELLNEIKRSYGEISKKDSKLVKPARAISGVKDFHDTASTNFIMEEKDTNKVKIIKSYSRMSREKIKKLLGDSNSGRKFILIQFSDNRSLYKKISISQYLKLSKIARVAIRVDFFTEIDGDFDYDSDDNRPFRRSIKEDAEILGYDVDTVFSMSDQVFGSINGLLEWHSRLQHFIDGIVLVFQISLAYSYCEDEYSIMVYQKNGKIKYYKDLIEFCKDYGLYE